MSLPPTTRATAGPATLLALTALFSTTAAQAVTIVASPAGGAVIAEPLPPPEPRGALTSTVAGIYERMVGLFPALLRGRGGPGMVVDSAPDAPDFDWQPDLGPDRREELRMAGGDSLTLRISSPGGSVLEGFAIMDALAAYPGEVTTFGVGYVASIASVILLAGDKVKMAEKYFEEKKYDMQKWDSERFSCHIREH